jgi:hypothetical protein
VKKKLKNCKPFEAPNQLYFPDHGIKNIGRHPKCLNVKPERKLPFGNLNAAEQDQCFPVFQVDS